MKICLFSDIHGNGDAFEAVFVQILKEKADLHICLGDTVGYYADEGEIIGRLEKVQNLIVLRGNHDEMYIRAGEGDGHIRSIYEQRYSSALEVFLEKDHRHALEWLKALPVSYVDVQDRFACYHASPWDPLMEYIYPDVRMDRFRALPQKYFFLGHTHYGMLLDMGDKKIVNPGSVGQPRDGHWPSFAVVDLDKGTSEIRYVPFDVDKFLGRIGISPTHPYLHNVFMRIKRDG